MALPRRRTGRRLLVGEGVLVSIFFVTCVRCTADASSPDARASAEPDDALSAGSGVSPPSSGIEDTLPATEAALASAAATIAAGEDDGAWRESDASALRELRSLMASKRMERPDELLQAASELRKGCLLYTSPSPRD